MYFFQKRDQKHAGWEAALAKKGLQVASISGSPISAPLELLKTILHGKRIDGYVFRYLNDYQSWVKTSVRLMSELFVIAIVRSLKGRILWIAHNVDRESATYYPTLSSMRRALICRAASAVLVTDRLLEPYARAKFPAAKRIGWICFGPVPDSPVNADTKILIDAIEDLRQSLRGKFPDKVILVGLCISAASTKCRHFLSACDFVDRFSTEELVVGMVVAGGVHELRDSRFQAARERMSEHEHIVLIDKVFVAREQYLNHDFFYRVLDDLSVSYSVYVAASVRKPLVTESDTFLAEMVNTYSLGVVVPIGSDARGGNWLNNKITAWDPECANKFLGQRNWDVAAARLQREMVSAKGPPDLIVKKDTG